MNQVSFGVFKNKIDSHLWEVVRVQHSKSRPRGRLP